MTSSALRTREILDRVRVGVASRRAEHARRRDLRRDLASYTTDAEVSDLLLMLEARNDTEVDDVRAIVLGNVAAATSAA